MLSCAPVDHTHDDQGSSSGGSSESTSNSDTTTSTSDTSTSTAVTLSGKVQKGPYVQGTEITVRELDSTMTPPQVTPSQAPSMTIQVVSASKEHSPIK